MYFSALLDSVILHLRTVLLLFCCAVCTALLFTYSSIFIPAGVRNKLTVIAIVNIYLHKINTRPTAFYSVRCCSEL